jgi:hypothetical protein
MYPRGEKHEWEWGFDRSKLAESEDPYLIEELERSLRFPEENAPP